MSCHLLHLKQTVASGANTYLRIGFGHEMPYPVAANDASTAKHDATRYTSRTVPLSRKGTNSLAECEYCGQRRGASQLDSGGGQAVGS